MPVLPGPAPLLLCAASLVDGPVPEVTALVAVVIGAESGAVLPVEPGPAPLLLCAASETDAGVGLAAAVPLSAFATCARPKTATVVNVWSNGLIFIV